MVQNTIAYPDLMLMISLWGSAYDEHSHQGLLVAGIEQCLWTLELVEDFEKMIDIKKPFSLMSMGEMIT